MIEFEEALKIITGTAQSVGIETIDIKNALNRVLAEDIFVDMNMPPFDKSAMDGFACKQSDLDLELEVVETIFAGKKPTHRIEHGQCAKIMTGAVVPEGADCVFMKEHSTVLGDNKVICTNPQTKLNICYKGEDLKVGDLVLKKNTLLKSQHLPQLAMAGVTTFKVFMQPAITVMATGTELVEANQKPLPFQIRNSNSSQIVAQINELGIDAVYAGIIGDEESVLEKTISDALQKSDVLILTGGVSVSEFDLVPSVLTKLGFEVLINGTAIQPGKPMIFAHNGEKYCFGLSGNPVSSFIQSMLYLQPFLRAMMNHSVQPQPVHLPLSSDFKRRKGGRLMLVPAVINEDSEIEPVEFHGSAHISALANAQVLFEIPQGIMELKKGDTVRIRFIGGM
nr:molybdopterin molybdotransferase MoeA [uncultured Carboxylicivirga sp.]